MPRPPLTDIRILIATWFGTGYLPWAPGTAGSLAGLPVAWGLGALGGPWVLAAAAALVTGIGVWAANVYMAEAGGTHDPGPVVIDEVAGQMLTIVPAAALLALTWQTALAGFLLFRLFDIVKPWPISWADRELKGGFGVMADDLLAGVAAALCLWGLIHWMPGPMGVA